jgi:hypothetical protein
MPIGRASRRSAAGIPVVGEGRDVAPHPASSPIAIGTSASAAC